MKPTLKFLPLGVIGALLSLTFGAAVGSAQNLQLDEVMAGAFGRSDLQFVELRLSDCEPRAWAGTARLAFFDAAGEEVGEFVFPGDPSVQGCFEPGWPVLVATQALADLPAAPEPDFIMPSLVVPGSGKVCFEGLTGGEPANLCLSYGAFTGDSEQGSSGNAPPLLPTRICSVQRQALFGDFSEPSFNEDFGLGEPLPRETEIVIPGRFRDVSLLQPFGRFAEALFNAGVTGGCGNGNFCPQAAVTRDQMAVFLLLAKEGEGFTPPACTIPVFADVPCSHPFAPWINELAARGITGGCGDGTYCPGSAVTREQMAVFLLLALEGPGFTPPACTVPVFGDVPCASPFAPWIHELAQRGITGGCGGGNFCPGLAVTREQMAVFLSSAFALPVPSFDCSDGPIPRDDHGDEPANATPLVPGVPTTATHEATSDLDVFSFTARAGEVFSIDVELLSDGSSLQVFFMRASGEFLPFGFGFRAPEDGTFFVHVSPNDSLARTGRYRILLSGPIADDHGDSAADATPVTPAVVPPGGGAGTAGVHEDPADVDVFAFAVQAGRIYAVEAHGNTFLELSVLDADGSTVLAQGDGSHFFEDLETVAVFQASATGTLFARVATSFFGGPYTLRVRGPLPDAAGTVPLTPLVPAFGELPEGDTDLFSFHANAGERFWVEVTALTVRDFTADVIGTNGVTVLATQGPTSDIHSLVAPATGTYFVRLRFSFVPSVYRIRLRLPIVDDHTFPPTALAINGPGVAGDIEFPGDIDMFTFTVAQAGFYRVEATDLSPGLRLFPGPLRPDGTLVSPSFLEPGTYFVRAQVQFFSSSTGTYRMSVTGPVADDHGDTQATATLLPPGSPEVSARLEIRGDVDVFAFDAVAGQRFRVKLSPAPSFSFDGFSLHFRDSTGAPVSSFTDVFTAPATGRFFLHIGGPETSYRLTLGLGVGDDHGDTPEDATLLVVDGPAINGFHQIAPLFQRDLDFFAFDAAAGETLTIETSGLGPSSDTVIELFGADGATSLAQDDDGAGALASRLTFTFPQAGRYFVRVIQEQLNITGIYQIAVRSQP